MSVNQRYVNVYHVTRQYGGPEEGGWWYDHYECVEVVPVRAERAEDMKSAIALDYAQDSYGDISSVLGGRSVQVLIEKTRAASETREKPRYE